MTLPQLLAAVTRYTRAAAALQVEVTADGQHLVGTPEQLTEYHAAKAPLDTFARHLAHTAFGPPRPGHPR